MKIRTVAVAAVTVLALSQAALAGAAPPSSTPVTLAENLVGPLHLAVGPGKAVTVAESFAGRLTTVHRGSSATTYAADGWDVAGSEYRGSTLFFVESVGAGPMDPRPMVGALKSIDNKGAVTTITDQFTQYETAHNPDGPVQYGLSPADAAAHPDCVSQLGALELLGSYTGADVEVDTHIYGLTVEGNHAYVADAGANTVFSVNLKTGQIKTLAVLPAQPVTISDEAGEALGIPACSGLSYGFEAVPTDIEMGSDGLLYVGLLPGGPEDATLGARGSISTIDPMTGAYEVFVDELLSPTGLALDEDGDVYFASLFGEGIFRVDAVTREKELFLPAVLAANVEISGSTLYATTGAFGNGALISQRL